VAIPLQSAVGALWQALRPAAGVAVTYTQGSTSLSIYAIPGFTEIDEQSEDGAIRTDKVQDFIFQASDLTVTPSRGDSVTWGSRVFEVVQPTGDRCYSYSDQYQRMIRVHTKEVYGS
jgi:hypothetical protein